MNTERDLNRSLAAYIADQLAEPAPADLLERVLKRTAQSQPRGALAARLGGDHLGSRRFSNVRLSPQLVWIALAALLMAALAGAVVAGALLRHDPVRSSYDAVFLRLDVGDDSHEVIVVAVDPDGSEREIAKLPGAWIAYDIVSGNEGYLDPDGAVSSSGLLAIASNRGEPRHMMHWEIFDLQRPEVEPIAVPGIREHFEILPHAPSLTPDSGSALSWGPGERLAIPYGSRLALVDGRTGAATSVAVPDDHFVLPRWAIDGSGVFLATGDLNQPDPRGVLRLDGAVSDDVIAGVAGEPGCRTRFDSGAEVMVSNGRVVRRELDGGVEELASGTGVGFACLAPDGSALVHDGISGSRASDNKAGSIDSASGDWREIDGSFAGWIKVVP